MDSQDTKVDRSNITTIKLSKKTKLRLEKLRLHKRETYEEILESMLDILNLCRLNPEAARKKLIMTDRQIRKKRRMEASR